MNPETAVATDPLVALLAFLGVITLLLFLIAKWRWHVFLALLVPLLLFGVIPGVKTNNFIVAFENGFGKTLGSIGVVIVLGSIMAEALRHTGAIQTITRSMVRVVGEKRMPLALTLTGFVLGMARLVLEIKKDSLSGTLYWLADVNFLHFAILLFAACSAVLVVVSLLTPAQDDEKLAGLTFATADAPGAEGLDVPDAFTKSDPAWRRKDLWLSLLLGGCVAAVWILFA